MNRKLAAEIHSHLLDAAAALRQAEYAAQRLRNREERRGFTTLLINVTMPLHFELLRALYSEHPELRPPEEDRIIDCTLRWEDVSLPKSVSTQNLDAAILGVLTPRLQKVAKVITDAAALCKKLRAKNRFHIIGARIIALADAGFIEGAGDLRMWRYSEVRLLPSGAGQITAH
jgi:hypothetical protein